MKLLHTSDWHVGKVLKGQSRLDDQIAALGQVVEVARAERPDLVIVAGDLYDTASPTADATKVVTRALSALRTTGADVVAIGGNHDNGPALDALAEAGFDDSAVNLVTTHLTVVGALAGGGEREAQTILGYAVPATVFPAAAHYVALGHLHRAQQVPAPCPVRYSGSPLAVDFGDAENASTVSIVEVTATTPAKARQVPITAATPLRTVRGTLAELSTMDTGEAWLRVYVREPPRAGLREQVQELMPRTLEVRIDPAVLPEATAGAKPVNRRVGRGAGELFGEYLASLGHADEATVGLFHRLYEEVS
jgi:DNA repair protein SbcD/Mre11